jgi:hypothetical protein
MIINESRDVRELQWLSIDAVDLLAIDQEADSVHFHQRSEIAK